MAVKLDSRTVGAVATLPTTDGQGRLCNLYKASLTVQFSMSPFRSVAGLALNIRIDGS
jgi:hypothetical protein